MARRDPILTRLLRKVGSKPAPRKAKRSATKRRVAKRAGRAGVLPQARLPSKLSASAVARPPAASALAAKTAQKPAPVATPPAQATPGTVAHIAAARAAQLGPKTKSAAVDRKERAVYIVSPDLKAAGHLAQLMVPSCAAVLPTIPVKVVHRDSVEREDLQVIARHRVLSREAMLLVIDGIVRARFTTASYATAQLLNTQLGRLLAAARGP